jgi:chaperonin GroEL (HSP60 family)
VVIIQAFKKALADALQIIDEIAVEVDVTNDAEMHKIISSSIGTKFVSRWSELMCGLALKAVRTVSMEVGAAKKEVDIKRYARIEKIPGGEIEDSEVLDGVMLNKDITHPKMRRRIENPRVLLLDCTLEYKKGESQTNIEVSKEEDWNRILQIEEEQVKGMCDAIIALKPDLVITEKGVSGKLKCIRIRETPLMSAQILHSTTWSRPTSPPSVESARPTTTVYRAPPAQSSSTRSSQLPHPTSAHSVGCSRSPRSVTSTSHSSQSAKIQRLAQSFYVALRKMS